jgi:hypothetical protein
MAIVKANYVKRGEGEKGRAKATIRYIQHRKGLDGATITRQLFGSDGPLDRHEAYRMIDEASKGSLFYRFILSPDPTKEDTGRDLDMRDLTDQTLQELEDLVHQPLLWVAAIHDDHSPNRHCHVVAIVPKRLYVKDFQRLRHRATQACREQRRFLELGRTHERERPNPLPTFATAPSRFASYRPHHQRRARLSEATRSSWRVTRAGLPGFLRRCTCPHCAAVRIHHTRDPVHKCKSCGQILHRQQLFLSRKEAGWERSRGY